MPRDLSLGLENLPFAASQRTDSGVYIQTSIPMISATKPSEATPRQPNEPITAAETIGAIKPPAEKNTR